MLLCSWLIWHNKNLLRTFYLKTSYGLLICLNCFNCSHISYYFTNFITDHHLQTFWWVGSSAPTTRAQAISTWHRIVQLSVADTSAVIQFPKSSVRVVSIQPLTLHAVPPWTAFRPAPSKAWHAQLEVLPPLPLPVQMLVATQPS